MFLRSLRMAKFTTGGASAILRGCAKNGTRPRRQASCRHAVHTLLYSGTNSVTLSCNFCRLECVHTGDREIRPVMLFPGVPGFDVTRF
jgi:hypothetical protein